MTVELDISFLEALEAAAITFGIAIVIFLPFFYFLGHLMDSHPLLAVILSIIYLFLIMTVQYWLEIKYGGK